MITEYGVLKPDVPRPAGPGQEAHEHWLQEQKEKWPDWKPLDPKYNIRFAHDPFWRDRVFSIQCCHDAVGDRFKNFNIKKPAHWFWGAVWLAMMAADMFWYARITKAYMP